MCLLEHNKIKIMAKSKRPNLKRLLKYRLLLVPLLLLIIVGIALARHDKGSPTTTRPVSPPTSSPVNLNPPTAQEKQETEQHKNEIAQQTTPPPSPTYSKKQATPIITDASRQRVLAYVSGVVENGGTCTATATNGSTTRTTSSQAVYDASTTDCAPLNFSPALGAGTWTVVVAYQSSASYGQSATVTIH